MPTFRLITDAAVEQGCADLIPLVEQYHRDVRQKAVPSGFTILPRINAQGMAAMELRTRCMAAPCDYNVLSGDGVPFIFQGADTYGHGYGPEPADGFLFGGSNLATDSTGMVVSWQDTGLQMAHSRMYYKAQSEDAADTSMDLYRKSLQRLLDNPKYEMMFDGAIVVDDHFAYDPYRSIGDGTRAQVPSWWTIKDLRGLSVTDTGSSRTDGEWEGAVSDPILVSANLDGGFQQGFYNTGYSADWRRIDPAIRFLIGFGSFFANEQNDQDLLTGCTTATWCTSGLCNWWGLMPIGLFLNGRPLGDVLTNNTNAPGERYLTAISGWCTDMITDNQLALTQVQSDIAALKAWQANVTAQLAGSPGSGPAGNGGVVNLARQATLSASSTLPLFPLSNINDGIHTAAQWGKGTASGGGWNDASQNIFPKWVEFDFATPETASKVIVTTLQDNFAAGAEPTDQMTFSLYGVTAFTILGWDGSQWQTLAQVTSNNLVKRTVTFPAFTGSKFRLQIDHATDGYGRLAEVEISGP